MKRAMKGRVMGKTQLRLAILALAPLLASSCAREEIGAAKYAADDCRRVTLIDADTGEAVRGAEDFAIDAENSRLFISAYDRRAVEKAARKKRDALPQGGLYAVTLADLFNPRIEKLTSASLVAPSDLAGGLHPHGLSYDAANHELVFINRTYLRVGRKWKMVPHLQRIGANGEIFVGKPQQAPCAANDVAVDEQGSVASFDHGSCGFGAGIENVFGLKRSGVSRDGETLYGKAGFANGLAYGASGDLFMAATREKALVVLGRDGLAETARIAVPGGPDNLTIGYDGGIVAAAHPSLTKLMFNRKFGFGAAPSRIIKANPETGHVDILFDDPKGKLFSAATVAIETQSGLAAGSVTDEGLLVCQASS